MHSKPGIDSPVIRIQTAGTEYISPVFGIPPQTICGWDHTHTQLDTLHYSLFAFYNFVQPLLLLSINENELLGYIET